MDIYFRQYWRDARLSFKSPINRLSLSIKVSGYAIVLKWKFKIIMHKIYNQTLFDFQMLERMWKPDTYFYNAKKSHIHTITVPNKLLRLSENGDILYSMR